MKEIWSDAVEIFFVAAAVVLVFVSIMWCIVRVSESDDRKETDIVKTCQEAEDPEVCQALA